MRQRHEDETGWGPNDLHRGKLGASSDAGGDGMEKIIRETQKEIENAFKAPHKAEVRVGDN